MEWNRDISQAPRGRFYTMHIQRNGKLIPQKMHAAETILLATRCGKVTASYWMPSRNRWNMLGTGEQPVAWMPWPAHPDETT